MFWQAHKEIWSWVINRWTWIQVNRNYPSQIWRRIRRRKRRRRKRRKRKEEEERRGGRTDGRKTDLSKTLGGKWSKVYNWNTRGENEKTNGQKKQLKRKTKKILKFIEDSKTQIQEAQRKPKMVSLCACTFLVSPCMS